MPLFLEDLAEDTAAGLRRTADRFDAAAKELARPDATGAEVARLARHLTAHAVAEVPRAEALWTWEADQPVKGPSNEEIERRLSAIQNVFAQQARLCVIARGVWELAEALGVAPERQDELHQAWCRFERLAHHMKTAIEHRAYGWQPKDSERFAAAMRRLEAGEMTFLTADEALARLKAKPTTPSGG